MGDNVDGGVDVDFDAIAGGLPCLSPCVCCPRPRPSQLTFTLLRQAKHALFLHSLPHPSPCASRERVAVIDVRNAVTHTVYNAYITPPLPPHRTDSQIARNGLPTRGAASGPSRRSLSWVTFDFLLRQWGTPELTERAAQDLFFNVRLLAPALSRLRLFAAFAGCLPPEDSGPSTEKDVEFHDEDALAFYLRAVTTFHRIRDELGSADPGEEDNNSRDGGGGGGTEEDDELHKYLAGISSPGDGTIESASIGGLDMASIMGGDSAKPIQELFPVTLQDPRTGRQYWHESAAVAEAVAKELFEKCSQAPPVEKGPGAGGGGAGGGGGGTAAPLRARVSDVQMSLGKLMGHPAVTGARDGKVDVDDVLWLFMKHWLVRTYGNALKRRVQFLLVVVRPNGLQRLTKNKLRSRRFHGCKKKKSRCQDIRRGKRKNIYDSERSVTPCYEYL